MQSNGCIAVLNIIESPNLDKCGDQIADQLKDIHACIFVFELWIHEPFESFKEFTAANRKSLKKVEWVLWANSQEQSRDIDAKIMKLVSKHFFSIITKSDLMTKLRLRLSLQKQWIGMFNLKYYKVDLEIASFKYNNFAFSLMERKKNDLLNFQIGINVQSK